MGSGWFLKSLQCKATALDDVVHGHHHHYSSSCKISARSLKDIVETKSIQTKPKPKPKPPFKRKPEPPVRTRSASAESFFPSLTELPDGHPSRNVVEIIFRSSWGERSFPGRVETVFKVQNLTRTVTRFEEYREMVRSTDAAEDHARCVADGNEVMRFYCLGATSGDGAYEAGCGAWDLYVEKGASVCTTYAESGCAHEKAGGGEGRRAMLVCRVIAGRVRKHEAATGKGAAGYDSVTEDNGELLVFDARALLPCFLVIYVL